MTAIHQLQNRPDDTLLCILRVAKLVSLFGVIAIASAILLAWVFPPVSKLLPGAWWLMKPNTALGMLLGTLAIIETRSRSRPRKHIGALAASVMIVLSCTALLGHATGHTYALELLFAAHDSAHSPGRMSIQTAVFLLLTGIALLSGTPRDKRLTRLSDIASVMQIMLVLVILAGYLFNASSLFGQDEIVRTSPQTLLCMILLGIATLEHRIHDGAFAIFAGPGIGGHTARLATPFVLSLPFIVVGVITYMTHHGTLTVPYAAALTASITAFLLFSLLLAVASRITSLERELQDLSLTDELTRLRNRRAFYMFGEYAVSQAPRRGTPLTVLFFDLDGLKTVNDTLGHEVGSDMLVDFADLLRRTFRSSDVIARLGGDEFAVITHESLNRCTLALERLDRAVADETARASTPYVIRYSVGEASLDSDNGERFEALVERADTLMFERKRRKKSRDAAGDPRDAQASLRHAPN